MEEGGEDEVHRHIKKCSSRNRGISMVGGAQSPMLTAHKHDDGALDEEQPGTFQELPEAMERHVTELDFAAYAKEDFTANMERKIMKRMFDSFDMLQQGALDVMSVKQLCKYLGAPDDKRHALEAEASAVVKKGGENAGLDFESFFQWWQKMESESKSDAFGVVSGDFSAPFHQQQLIRVETGEIFTPSYRVSFMFKDVETGELAQVSPWHDVPLKIVDLVRTSPEDRVSNRFNFCCEIPKWTRAKFEIATKEPFNPIKQDMKNGVPRFYKHGDMMWNYGAFPQTWESTEINFLTGEDEGSESVKGDNDPVDAIEIGMVQMKTGQVSEVKVLGILGMLDEGEMDWKVICICRRDPIAKFLNDIEDVPKFLPGCLDTLREWLRVYKICQGGVENTFAFDGEYKNKEYAMKVLHESHLMWSNLKKITQRKVV